MQWLPSLPADPLSAALLGLATWRLASLLIAERGPGEVFVWLRRRVGIEHDENGAPVTWPDGFVTSLFTCIWCLSPWLALPILALWWWAPVAIWVLALSAAAIVVQSLVDRLNR